MGAPIFAGGIGQKCHAFLVRDFTKSWMVGGKSGDFSLCACRFLLGDGTKALCFFGAKLHKITEHWRGKGVLFVLGGLVFCWEIVQKNRDFSM